jgi:hypothetical protein
VERGRKIDRDNPPLVQKQSDNLVKHKNIGPAAAKMNLLVEKQATAGSRPSITVVIFV